MKASATLEREKLAKELEKQAAKEEAARQKKMQRLQREAERRAHATQRVIESTVRSVGTTAARTLTRSFFGDAAGSKRAISQRLRAPYPHSAFSVESNTSEVMGEYFVGEWGCIQCSATVVSR